MLDRDPTRASLDKSMAGLDAIGMLEKLTDKFENAKDITANDLMEFVDKAISEACENNVYAYQAVRRDMCAIVQGGEAKCRWLPPRARTFMDAFEVA